MRVTLFTIDQAEKALPLVSRIVGDIVTTFQSREKSLEKRKALPLQPTPGSDTEEQAFALERELEAFDEEIRRYLVELEAIGVELKDFRLGLIDFYSRFDGRVVYLCWKHGESEQLAWYHDLQAGFRGRKPITPENRTRFKGHEAGEKYVELGEV
jgi:hypothetical protein